MSTTPDINEERAVRDRWAADVFTFAEEALGMLPAEPLDELRGVAIPFTDEWGNRKSALLFDRDGKLLYHDLAFYTRDMFKFQDAESFKSYDGTRFTWMQTVILTAYQRGIETFGKDSYAEALRWITVRSGHGIGKTGSESIICLHFLVCFDGSQIGMTANTEQQVQDIFMKELSVWRMKLPKPLRECLVQTIDHVRVEDSQDWFLRAQVARVEKPEALAGLHAKYVLIVVDEASGVPDKVFEVMKGALTGDYFIVIYCSNPTRNEGEFFESHKAGSEFTKLKFSSRDSPIVKPGYIAKMEADYPGTEGEPSDEVKIRVDGEFAGLTEMDDKGWIPLFANIQIHFEPQRFQVIRKGIIGVDPAGKGRDRSIVHVRDAVYLKEVLNEATSNPKDGARKVETIRDTYDCSSNDIGIDAFGEGARWVAEIETKMGETVNAILSDKPREETKDRFATFKAEMAWRLRTWLGMGGIIITNNKAAWLKEFEKIKYKRDAQGRIHLQGKVEFKKLHGFSPDRFDAAIHTFFKEEPSAPVILTKSELEAKELLDFMAKATKTDAPRDLSSM